MFYFSRHPTENNLNAAAGVSKPPKLIGVPVLTITITFDSGFFKIWDTNLDTLKHKA